MFEKHAAARFGASVAPPISRPFDLQRPGTDGRDLPELRVANELIECLHVGAEPMIVPHHQPAIGLVRRREAPFDATGGERQRPLAQHMQLGPQRRQHVGLVQVIRGGDDHGIEFIALEEFLEVGEHVGHAKPIGDRSRFGRVVIAQRHQLGTAQLGQNRDVRQLGNGTRANDGYPHAVFHYASGDDRSVGESDDGPRIVMAQDGACIETGP